MTLRNPQNRFKNRKVFYLIVCFFSLYGLSMSAQVQTITGVVNDDTNVPLPGVTIIETGTSNGVTTDFDGNFSIQITQDSSLTFSYIGYKTEVVEPDSLTSTPLTINLQPDLNRLSDVVVVGYGSVKRKDVTGSVATVKWIN